MRTVDGGGAEERKKKEERRATAGLESRYRENRSNFLTPKESCAPVRYVIDVRARHLSISTRDRAERIAADRNSVVHERASTRPARRARTQRKWKKNRRGGRGEREDLRPRRDATSPKPADPFRSSFCLLGVCMCTCPWCVPTRCLTLSLPVSPIVGTLFLHLQTAQTKF